MIADILGLFHRRLLLLTGIAFLLGAPVTWYILRRWLQQYAYTVDLNAGIFLLAGLLTLAIASLAVLGQSWRAARANPVEALRTE